MEEGTLEIVRWTATGTGILGAMLCAANLGARVTGSGFVVFTVSSVAWVTAGWLDGTTSLVVQNAVLFLINLIGIYRWLIMRREERETIIEAGPAAKPPIPGATLLVPRRPTWKSPT